MMEWINFATTLVALAGLGHLLWRDRRHEAPADPTIPSTGAFDPQAGEHENVTIARARAKFMLQLVDEFRLRGTTAADGFEMARAWMRAGEEADLLKPSGLKGGK